MNHSLHRRSDHRGPVKPLTKGTEKSVSNIEEMVGPALRIRP